MHEAVSVRAATPDDAPAVTELVHMLGYTITQEEALARLRDFHDSDRDHVFVAQAVGALHGFVVLCLMPGFVEPGWVSRITALAVSRKSRQRGIGRMLLAEAEAAAVAAGSRLMQINCGRRPERAGAHRFYLECGYGDQHSHHILYDKRL
jgi:ribosomal protein S18 acetylase RimI-like enzyme